MRSILACTALAVAIVLATPSVKAEEATTTAAATTCDTYIDALPYTVTAPGNYCLRRNLTTDLTPAIMLNASGATLDCLNRTVTLTQNQYPSGYIGVLVAPNVSNATVQNCTISGFGTGVMTASNGSSNAVKNNRIQNFIALGIQGGGDNFQAVNNRITYGGSVDNAVSGIVLTGADGHPATGQVLTNNLIAGLWGTQVTGISMWDSIGTRVINNHLMGMRVNGGVGWVYGIVAYGGGMADLQTINNSVSAMSSDQWFMPMYAVPKPALCRGNTVYNSGNIPFNDCVRSIDNITVNTPLW